MPAFSTTSKVHHGDARARRDRPVLSHRSRYNNQGCTMRAARALEEAIEMYAQSMIQSQSTCDNQDRFQNAVRQADPRARVRSGTRPLSICEFTTVTTWKQPQIHQYDTRQIASLSLSYHTLLCATTHCNNNPVQKHLRESAPYFYMTPRQFPRSRAPRICWCLDFKCGSTTMRRTSWPR